MTGIFLYIGILIYLFLFIAIVLALVFLFRISKSLKIIAEKIDNKEKIDDFKYD